MNVPKSIRPLLAGLASLLVVSPALAQSLIAASPDVTIALGAGTVVAHDHDVVIDNQLGVVVLESIGAIPAASDVIAYSRVGNTQALAFDVTTQLAGGVVARPGDVVLYDGAQFVPFFVADDNELPDGIRVDAVSFAPGGLLLSFDRAVEWAGSVLADEDLARWAIDAVTPVFDGSTFAVESRVDVDAAQDLGFGDFLVSFDVSGEIEGVFFDDEDVLRFEDGVWSMEFDGSAADSAWVRADLQAIAVPEPMGQGGLMLGCLLLVVGVAMRGGRRRSWATSAIGIVLAAGASLGFALESRASDGRVEIDQTCAEQTGCLPGDFAGFPVTIDGTGGRSVVLTSDLVIPDPNLDAIVITTPDVTIDLNDHRIIAVGCVPPLTMCPLMYSTTGSGITAAPVTLPGLVVRNGQVVGMGGVGIDLGRYAEVRDVVARANRYTGVLARPGSIVVDSVAEDNRWRGITTAQVPFGGSVVVGNVASRSSLEGILSGDTAVVANNTVRLNVNTGLSGGLGSVLLGNAAYDNMADGLFANGWSVVTGNSSYSNDGNGFQTNAGSLVRGNVARGNGNYGFYAGVTAGLRENVSTGNTTAAVLYGLDLGANACNGTTTCP